MATYEAAVAAHARAQQREAELRALLHAAEARTRQLRQAMDGAAAHLGDATLRLGRLQYTRNALQSRLAEHMHCQRAAILLPSTSCDAGDDEDDAAAAAAAASRLPPLRLCRVDPFSLLDTRAGEGLAVDLVDVARRPSLPAADPTGVALEPWRTGIYGDEADPDGDVAAGSGTDDITAEVDEDGDGEVEAALPAAPTLTSLLQQVVRDVLQGYHHTCLCTTAAAADEPQEDGGGADPSALCLRLLHLLQREALRCGTRALSVTLAVGRVDADAGVWRDVLQPAAVRHGQLTLAVDAVPAESGDASREEDAHAFHHRRFSLSAGGGSCSSSGRAGSHVGAAAPSAAASLTRLAGVPVCSLEEAAYWLGEAGVPSAGPGGVVVVLGVDSQAAGGGLRKSLLRILVESTAAPRGAPRSSGAAAPAPRPSPSVFALYMRDVLEAAALAALPGPGPGLDTGAIAQYLDGAVGPAPLPAHKLRAIVAAASSGCPSKPQAQRGPLKAVRASAWDAAWALWAALLRPVFGGNCKAVWVHHHGESGLSTHSTASRHAHSGRAAGAMAATPTADAGAVRRRGSVACSAPSDPVDALRLCAVFCRLVRHAAVPTEVSPELVQLLRGGRERR